MKSGILCLAFATLLTASAASASTLCGDVCEVSLRPGVISAPLPLEGWVFSDASAVTVIVQDAPLFGDWTNEVYDPSPDFWDVGADRIRLVVTEKTSGTVSRHTLLIKVAAVTVDTSYQEDFEQTAGDVMNLEPAWDVLDPTGLSITSTDAISGTYSLAVDIAPGSVASRIIERADQEPITNGIDQMSARVVVNVSPPPTLGETFRYTVLTLGEYATIDLFHVNGEYKLQAYVSNVDCPAVDPCQTTAQTLIAGADYNIRASIGRMARTHPSTENAYSFDLQIAEVAGPGLVEQQIPDLGPLEARLAPTPSMCLGGVTEDASGPGTFTVVLDDVEYQDGWIHPSPLSGLLEDFEGGAWSSAWIGVGPLATSSGSSGFGLSGQAVDWTGVIDLMDLGPSPDEAWWMDLGPDQSETLWAHLELDTAAFVGLGNWSNFRLVEGENAAGTRFLALKVRLGPSGQPQVLGRIRDGSGAYITTGWLDLAATSRIDIAWNGPEARLTLYVDGQSSEIVGLPSPYQLDRLSLGVGQLTVNGGASISSTRELYFDDFVVLYD